MPHLGTSTPGKSTLNEPSTAKSAQRDTIQVIGRAEFLRALPRDEHLNVCRVGFIAGVSLARCFG